MTVVLRGGVRPGMRWKLLLLAAGVGFVGRGGLSASRATILAVLLGLFVIVFFAALAVSMLSDRAALEPEPDIGSLLTAIPESVQVQREAAFGSP